MAETPRRREAHCDPSAPKVRGHWGHSLAVVKGHCRSHHARLEAQSCWVKSIRAGTKITVLCLWASFRIVCLCTCMCLFAEIQLTQAFHSPGISSFPPWEWNWGGARVEWIVWTPLLCPYCANVASSIALQLRLLAKENCCTRHFEIKVQSTCVRHEETRQRAERGQRSGPTNYTQSPAHFPISWNICLSIHT